MHPAPIEWPVGVWRADGLAAAAEPVLPTGLPALDTALPGGGWPLGALTELLQEQPQAPVWRLLAPALAAAQARGPGALVLVGSPYEPFIPGLAAQGLDASRWLRVDADTPAARLWATEQALRCAEVAAVLAWLPQAGAADLRRLQLAAQRHRQLLFVMRPLSAAAQASPARLRLVLEAGDAADRSRAQGARHAADAAVRVTAGPLRVRVLKRRGPPCASPVLLPPHAPALARLLRARTAGVPAGRVAGDAFVTASAVASPRAPHGLDRAAARA